MFTHSVVCGCGILVTLTRNTSTPSSNLCALIRESASELFTWSVWWNETVKIPSCWQNGSSNSSPSDTASCGRRRHPHDDALLAKVRSTCKFNKPLRSTVQLWRAAAAPLVEWENHFVMPTYAVIILESNCNGPGTVCGPFAVCWDNVRHRIILRSQHNYMHKAIHLMLSDLSLTLTLSDCPSRLDGFNLQMTN